MIAANLRRLVASVRLRHNAHKAACSRHEVERLRQFRADIDALEAVEHRTQVALSIERQEIEAAL